MAARTSTDGEAAATRPLVKWSCYDVASLRTRVSPKKCFQVYEIARELRFLDYNCILETEMRADTAFLTLVASSYCTHAPIAFTICTTDLRWHFSLDYKLGRK